jgi:hypothetical protein
MTEKNGKEENKKSPGSLMENEKKRGKSLAFNDRLKRIQLKELNK